MTEPPANTGDGANDADVTRADSPAELATVMQSSKNMVAESFWQSYECTSRG